MEIVIYSRPTGHLDIIKKSELSARQTRAIIRDELQPFRLRIVCTRDNNNMHLIKKINILLLKTIRLK